MEIVAAIAVATVVFAAIFAFYMSFGCRNIREI